MKTRAFFLAFALSQTAVYSAQAAEPEKAPPASSDVLNERKNGFLSEMRRLDAEFQLIPYKYREIEDKVRQIDTELAKRAQPEKEKAETK